MDQLRFLFFVHSIQGFFELLGRHWARVHFDLVGGALAGRIEVNQIYLSHWAFFAPGPVSSSSTTEARVARFCFASGAIDVRIDCVSPPGSIIVSSSSAPSAERTGSAYVHWDWDVVHAAGRVGGVETVRVIERSVWIALEVPLEVRKRSAEAARLELWTWDVRRIAALLFQYVV